MKCCVSNCASSYGCGDRSFFNFPSNAAIRKKWINFCGQGDNLKTKHSVICMLHFKKEDFQNSLEFEMGFSKKRQLKREAVPSISNVQLYEEHSKRIEKRENQKIVEIALHEFENNKALQEETQTFLNEIFVAASLDFENDYVKKEVETLRKEYHSMKQLQKKHAAEVCEFEKKIKSNEFEIDDMTKRIDKQAYELRNLEEKLETIFTKGQINKLKNNIKRPTWTEEDIAQSITLHAAGSKLYKLLYRKKFPIPSVRTLQRWAQKIDICRGLIQPVFKILAASTHMTDNQKLCVLSFDEMKIRSSYCYDKSTDTTMAPVSYVQVGMLRGLMAKWKQPIFYDFNCKMTKVILYSLLEAAEKCGYVVIAVVSDLGGGNRALFNELKINEENPWFFFNSKKVFAFADVPHLIKLLRNHFLDQGFVINGKTVQKDVILKLLDVTSDDLNIAHKISRTNLTLTGAQRQKVKLATKLFSHTVAQALTRAASHGLLEGLNWNECYTLFKVTNDWFDVMNTRVPTADSRLRCHAYGLALTEQNGILDQMSDLMKNIRAVGKKSLLPFQKGVIQSNNALKGLLTDLKERYDFRFILTYRLNQDVLENFFGLIRTKGGLHDHPDQQEFKFRLRSYLLGRNDGIISDAGNIEEDNTPDLERNGKSLTGTIFNNMNVEYDIDESPPEEVELESMAYDGLENIAGYICHKLKDDVSNIAMNDHSDSHSYTWVDHLSEGGLSKPTDEMMGNMQALHNIFQELNKESLLITSNFLFKHFNKAAEVPCDDKVKQLFFAPVCISDLEI